MKKLNLLKLFVGTMLAFAATAFTGCVDDNDDTELPYLEVTPTTLAFDASGAPTEGGGKFVVKTNRPWQLIIDEKDMTWVRPSATSGKGSGEVSFNIPAEANGRMATLTFQVSNTYGPYLEQKVTITQGEGSVSGEVIYSTNIGTKAVSSSAGWPYADAYDDWQATGTGVEGVTYSSSNVSVRNTGKSNIGAYDGASGPNVLFFSTAPAYVSVNKIALTSTQTRLQLTFGASRSVRNESDGTYDNTFDTSKFIVSLSADGTAWTPITYEINDGDKKDPFWVLATANFTLAQPVSELYMKFEATESSVFRMDDIKLAEGMGGQSVDLGSGSGALVVSPQAVSLGSAAGATATVTVTAAETWTASTTGSGFSIDKTTNAAGTSTVTVTAANANTSSSSVTLGTIVFTGGGETKTVSVAQQGTGGAAGDVIYYTNIGTKAVSSSEGWPYADAYDDWQATGSGASDVSYTSQNVTIRNSGLSNAGTYDGASGPNVLFFGKVPAYVAFNNIALTSSQTKLQLTFGASRSARNADNTYDNSFDASKFIVSLSANGTDWTPITYTKNSGDTAHPFWVLATADFTLSKAVSALYIKFEASEASVFRLDDIKLTEGNGGQSVDLGGGSSALSVSPTALSLAGTAGATANVTVTATAGWTATTTGSGFTIDKMGADGNATVVVTAAAANTSSSTVELGTIVFKSGTDSKTVTVSQQPGGSSTEDIYYETFGVPVKDGSYWPYANVSAANIKGGTGFVEGTTTYKGYNTSARIANSASSPNPPFSGEGHCWFPANKPIEQNYFEVENLVMSGQKNLTFEFGVYGNTSAYTDGSLVLEISADGTNWKTIDFTVSEVTVGGVPVEPAWKMAKADISLVNAVSNLSVKWSSGVGNTRADDLRIYEGNGGTSVDLGSSSETPTLEVSPLDVTLDNTANATKTFTVTTTAAWTATASGAGFSINPASGTGNATVTVTATAANTDSSEKTLGSVLVSATGVSATKTVTVKQAAGGGSVNPGTTTITFTSPDIATPSIPLPANAGHDRTAYVIGGQTYYLYADAAQSGKYQWQDNSSYEGAVAPFTGVYLKMGYFELPAVAGKSLTSVTLTSTGGMGKGVMAGIYNTDGQVVVAPESFTKNTPLTFGIDGAANTAYRIQITAGNAQIHKIEMTYSDGGVTPPPAEITAVNPTSLSFPKEGGSETIAVTVTNQGSSALSVSGLTSPFTASVSGNTVTVTAQANTGAAVNQTLTISVAGGNSKTVPVSIADGQGGVEPGGDLTLVTTVAGLSNGTYYMAGWANNGAYNVWNGTLANAQCVTSPYSFADGKLTATTTFDDLTEVTLEAVSGVADAFYIKNMDGKYLTVSKDGKNALVLVDDAGNNSWTLSDFDEHGVKASSNAFSSNMFTSVGASSRFIRSYAVTNTTGIGGIAFFKKK